MIVLRQSTAVDVLIGPFVDATDGDAEETGLTIAASAVLLSKLGQALTLKTDDTTAAHDAAGNYNCELDATDTDTVGSLVLFVHVSGALAVRHEFQVVEEAVYDALYVAGAVGPLVADDDGTNLVEAGGDGDHLTAVSLAATGLDLVLVGSTFVAALIAGVWDRVLSGATHNITNSAGRRVRQLQEAGGYSGSQVYIDTVNGNAGTVAFENGTDVNPSASLADALTIAAALPAPLTTFHISSGSTIALPVGGFTDMVMMGENWILQLAGRDIDGSTFIGAAVSGVSTNTTGRQAFDHCRVGNVTAADDSHFDNCGLAGTLTLVAGDTFFTAGHHAGGLVDFAAAGATTFHAHGYRGNIEFQNMAAGDVVFLGGSGAVTSNANNAAGTINVRGPWIVVDNGSATIVLDDPATDINAVLVDTGTTIPATLGTPADTDLATDIAAVQTATDAIPTTVMRGTDNSLLASTFTTMFAGITVLAEWLGLIAGNQVGDATARTELRATGAGSGTFDETTDSQEAIRDTEPLGTAMRGTDSVDTATMRGTDNSLLASTFSTVFSGITALGEWLGLIAGKQTGNATARTELRATGAGSGTYDETTDAQEAIRDTAPMGTAMRGTDNANTTTPPTTTQIRDAIMPTQNAAFSNIEFLWVATSNHVTPVTAASGTSVTRSIDGGAFASATGTLAEVGNGIYQFDASAADMNGGIITFRFVATGGTPGAPDDLFLTIVTGGGV